MEPNASQHQTVADTLAVAPIVGVVRSRDSDDAAAQAQAAIEAGVGLVEVTFTVPDAPALTKRLIALGSDSWIGMGSVTTAARARDAIAAGAQFIVSPNVAPEVAAVARETGVFLIVGALTPTEIEAAHRLGADLVKVYPLPAVGGPDYLEVVRGPLWDVPMLAAGGFGVDEIPAYRQAGAVAFGLAVPTLLQGSDTPSRNVSRAVSLARGSVR